MSVMPSLYQPPDRFCALCRAVDQTRHVRETTRDRNFTQAKMQRDAVGGR